MSNEEKLGLQVIEILSLKKDKKGLVKTNWGTKTALGLGLVIQRLVEENTEPKPDNIRAIELINELQTILPNLKLN